jgi:hypothetical protein
MNEIAVAPAVLFVVFIECIAVSWFYGNSNEAERLSLIVLSAGVNRFSNDIKAMIGSRPSLFWRSIWYLISPMFLLVSVTTDDAAARYTTSAS